MRTICELNDCIILGIEGRSNRTPRITARAIVKNRDGLYAVMYAKKFGLYSLPGGGVEEGEDVLSALKREVLEETGCTCGEIQELGIVEENRGTLDYTQINHYYVVVADRIGKLCLTETEQNNHTVIEWCTLPEAVRRITEQDFERVQGKYLRARDIAALEEYQKQYST